MVPRRKREKTKKKKEKLFEKIMAENFPSLGRERASGTKIPRQF